MLKLLLYTALTNTSKILHLEFIWRHFSIVVLVRSLFLETSYIITACIYQRKSYHVQFCLAMQLHTEEMIHSIHSFACRYYAEVK